MEFLLDPSILIGLLTLVVLEIVLGIDNLIFIAILSEKLPEHQRDKARITGLSLALLMRLALLSLISWLVTLTAPLLSLWSLTFSGRDLILLFGGIFLLYKAVTELHEKLEGKLDHKPNTGNFQAKFGLVVTQIVVLDAVFSLDSVITAVGMVDELAIMMIAVVIAMVIILHASKPLMFFVNSHPTVVILCLSFLLMIGVSLVADGLGFHIPKGYIYSGIGFAILIEVFNQYGQHNRIKYQKRIPLRDKAANLIYRLMAGKSQGANFELDDSQLSQAFQPEERYMMHGVLSLANRKIKTIMVPREEISWINIHDDLDNIRSKTLSVPHNLLPLCDGCLDQVIAVVKAKSIINDLDQLKAETYIQTLKTPIWIDENLSVIDSIKILRQAKGSLLIVRDNSFKVVGLVSPVDLLEAIAGDFPDADELPDVKELAPNQWIFDGNVNFYQLEQELSLIEVNLIADKGKSINEHCQEILEGNLFPGAQWNNSQFRLTVLKMNDKHVSQVLIEKLR